MRFGMSDAAEKTISMGYLENPEEISDDGFFQNAKAFHNSLNAYVALELLSMTAKNTGARLAKARKQRPNGKPHKERANAYNFAEQNLPAGLGNIAWQRCKRNAEQNLPALWQNTIAAAGTGIWPAAGMKLVFSADFVRQNLSNSFTA